MKTVLTGIVVVSILALGTFAFAHGWGGGQMMGPGYGGSMMGSGYGNNMMGPGYGGNMMGPGYGHMGGWAGQGYGNVQTDRKFLDETAGLRKDLHNKRFELFEAQRDPSTTVERLEKLEKEVYALQDKISEKAPRAAYGSTAGYGYCH